MADMRRRQALFPSIYAGATEKLQAVRFGAVVSKATADTTARVPIEVVLPSETRTTTQIPIFDTFMRMGLVPPFSDFFLEILRAYELKLLHLNPGTILDLSVFAYACEAFVGVKPSVVLFRHFFYPP